MRWIMLSVSVIAFALLANACSELLCQTKAVPAGSASAKARADAQAAAVERMKKSAKLKAGDDPVLADANWTQLIELRREVKDLRAELELVRKDVALLKEKR